MLNLKLEIQNVEQANINPGMFGLFYEDINYACDGGISAQMLENGFFEFREALGTWGAFSDREDGLYGWLPYPTKGDGAKMTLGTTEPVSERNPHYLHLETSDTQNGVVNKAYDGVSLKAGETYIVEAYLRSRDYAGPVYVSLLETRKKEGERSKDYPVLSVVLSASVETSWKKCTVSFESPADVRHGKFVISLGEPFSDGAGTLKAVSIANTCPSHSLELDFISLKPADAVMGVFRKDITDLLKGMKPGFLRFPGGCIVEGAKLSNRYLWKNTVGKREDRIRTSSRWALHFNQGEGDFAVNRFSHYNQSFDIGYYEYFLLCEYIGAKPLPVQNVGIACQYQTDQKVPVDSPDFMEFVQDTLDLIEFANGPVTSKWGALRAEMGHPDSFGLELLGIGNEQWETEDVQFFERYRIFEEKIHEKYPEIRLIGSAGPDVTSEHYTDAWAYYREKIGQNPDFAYALDEHYYNSIPWFYENNHFYDDYRRDIKVFAGEYAAHTSWEDDHDVKNCLDAAISEAAFLTGVQRNSDVVVMASYAPLFARVGYTQWSPNLIWFDDRIAYGSPNYYIQKLYALNAGDVNLDSRLEQGEENKVYQVVSLDKTTGETIIKLVNGNPAEVSVDIELEGNTLTQVLTATIVTGENGATVNSVEEPENVCDRQVTLTHTDKGYILPGLSMTVIRIK